MYQFESIESFVMEDIGEDFLLEFRNVPEEALKIASQMHVYWYAKGNFVEIWDEVRLNTMKKTC